MAAKRIEDLLGRVSADVNSTVESMGQATQVVQEGLIVMGVAGESFARIRQSVVGVTNQVEEVSAGVQQMSANSARVSQTVRGISEVAMQNAAGTENVSASTQEQLASMEEITASATALSQMAEELQILLDKFKV